MSNMSKHQPTRREFIGTLAAGGVGYFVSGTPARGQSKSPNEKLHVACIGAGGKGETNILGVMRENVVAVAEVDTERGTKGLKLIPKAKLYADYREMLDKEKGLDAVVVSTPDHHHAPASIRAMRLGYHVYCEKPLAHSIYEARVMRQVAAEKKVATQMGNQGHSGPVLREAVEVIRSGAIGQVTEFHAWTNRPSWPQGLDRPTDAAAIPSSLNWDLWLGPAPERPYHPAYCPFKWRGWWDFGTGALGDMACHIIDMGFWALELGYPSHVEAEASDTHPESGPKSSTIRYQFPARGNAPPVKFTWYDGGRKPDPALVGLSELPGGGSILVGDKGTMYVPSDYGSKYFLLPKEKFEGYKPPTPTLPRATAMASEILVAGAHYTEWLTACKGGARSQSNFDYAGFLTEVVLLGNLAVRTGKSFDWDGDQMKAKGMPELDILIKPPMRKGWEV
jgi:predicted dehydrogenase